MNLLQGLAASNKSNIRVIPTPPQAKPKAPAHPPVARASCASNRRRASYSSAPGEVLPISRHDAAAGGTRRSSRCRSDDSTRTPAGMAHSKAGGMEGPPSWCLLRKPTAARFAHRATAQTMGAAATQMHANRTCSSNPSDAPSTSVANAAALPLPRSHHRHAPSRVTSRPPTLCTAGQITGLRGRLSGWLCHPPPGSASQHQCIAALCRHLWNGALPPGSTYLPKQQHSIAAAPHQLVGQGVRQRLRLQCWATGNSSRSKQGGGSK